MCFQTKDLLLGLILKVLLHSKELIVKQNKISFYYSDFTENHVVSHRENIITAKKYILTL